MFIKRLLCIVMIGIFIGCMIPSAAFAAPVLDTDTIQQFGVIIIDISGMADNVNMTYDLTTTESALTVVQELYQTYVSETGEPYTLAALSAAALVGGAIAVIYDAVTGQGFIQLANETYINSMDGYWDYQLVDAGLTRDAITGLFEWPDVDGDVTPIQLAVSYGIFFDQPISTSQSYPKFVGHTLNDSYNESATRNKDVDIYASNNDYVYAFAFTAQDGYIKLGYATLSNQSTLNVNVKYGNGSWQSKTTSSVYNNYNLRAYWLGPAYDQSSMTVPYFSTFEDGLTAVQNVINNGVENTEISIEPVNDDDLVITVPNISNPDYEPSSGYVLTNVPWDPTWGNPLPEGVSTPEPGVAYPITDPEILNNLVPDLYEELIAGDVSIQDPPTPNPPGPGGSASEVFTPLLPTTLPSFNFNFSGIWHYVREWVTSLRSFFTLLFSVWTNLPYAIVVPVYASAVVVIVLGVYKRFFG